MATKGWGTVAKGLDGKVERQFAQVSDLAARARRRVPRFAWDFVASGCVDDRAFRENGRALDAVQIVPRYGVDVSAVSPRVTLFGRDYALPVGVAPMGLTSLGWPDTDAILARAMQAANTPYVLSTVSSLSIEAAAKIAPDVFWFQLYGAPADDHAISLDLSARAARAGAHVLMVTLDVPTRSRRVRDIRNGLVVPFRLRTRTVLDVARAPEWAWATLRHGQPRFGNFDPYVPADATTSDIAEFSYQKISGAVTWDAVARIRDAWPRAFVVKGILHPDDAEKALALGADGILVSNHGGRQFDAAPAPIDALPAIAARVAGRAIVMMDGGVRSGLDVARALARGADAVLAGRAFLFGAMALGKAGGKHVVSLFEAELRAAMGQSGATTIPSLRSLMVRHANALEYPSAAAPSTERPPIRIVTPG